MKISYTKLNHYLSVILKKRGLIPFSYLYAKYVVTVKSAVISLA